MRPTGVVAALASEARALGRVRRAARQAPPTARHSGVGVLADGSLIVVCGIGGPAAATAARTLIDSGAAALVSWGMAGGLDPALVAGTICLPRTIISGDGERYGTATRWRDALHAALDPQAMAGGGRVAAAGTPGVAAGTLLTSPRALDTVAAKAAAFAATGAAAVDMESAAIARVATAGGLPFIAVRVIVDTAGDTLPAAVIAAGAAGQIRPWRLVRGVLRSPSVLAPLLRLAGRYRAAGRGLGTVARIGIRAPDAIA